MFPERDRSDGRSLRIAAVASLALHVVLGAVLFAHARAPQPGRVEQVAQTSTITIEQLATPSPTPRPTPVPTPRDTPVPVETRAPAVSKPAVAIATHRPSASLPRRFSLPVPTLAPPAVPRAHERARLHVPRTRVLAYAPHAPVRARPSSGLDPQQMAALDARFRSTIAQAQHALEATPAPAPVRTTNTVHPYDSYLNVNVNDVVEGNGDCTPSNIDDAGVRRGNYIYYYLRCSVHYSDGYSETVEFPWPFKFTNADDPFRDGRRHSFPGQPPPPGFTLPHPFALSRAVCAYFRAECQAVIDQERAKGLIPG